MLTEQEIEEAFKALENFKKSVSKEEKSGICPDCNVPITNCDYMFICLKCRRIFEDGPSELILEKKPPKIHNRSYIRKLLNNIFDGVDGMEFDWLMIFLNQRIARANCFISPTIPRCKNYPFILEKIYEDFLNKPEKAALCRKKLPPETREKYERWWIFVRAEIWRDSEPKRPLCKNPVNGEFLDASLFQYAKEKVQNSFPKTVQIGFSKDGRIMGNVGKAWKSLFTKNGLPAKNLPKEFALIR